MYQHDRHAAPHRAEDGVFDTGTGASQPEEGLQYIACNKVYKYEPQVELARVTCEKERRHREKEARMEKQRLMEAQRNKAALDRALAPPFRPSGRRPVFR